ncbi:MAG: type II secretion system F family protein [Candidatus Eremiobacteraeota bacterium]|nr:type II secretion system F family protein [Candidatus Eremiobacteraeota bacterium]
MHVYCFKAIDSADQLVCGQFAAPSIDFAQQRLREVYRTILVLEPSHSRAGLRGPSTPKVKKASLSIYCRQLAAMVNAGISINRAFRFCAGGDDARLNVVMQKVACDIEAGMSVARALNEQPHVFGQTFVSLVAAGEESGTMDTTLKKLADLLEQQVGLEKRVQSTMAYPAVIAVVAVAVVAFFIFYILPMMLPVFTEMSMELPWPTRMLVAVTGLARNPFLMIPGGLLSFACLFGISRVLADIESYPGLRRKFDELILKVPVLGKLYRLNGQARVLFTMGTMLDAGVPLLKCLEVVEKVATNVVLAEGLYKSRRALLNGHSFYDALRTYDVFSKIALQMIKVGQETGTLSDMVLRVGALYDDQLAHQLEMIAGMIEPLMMAFIGGVVGFITLASFLPMVSLLNNL